MAPYHSVAQAAALQAAEIKSITFPLTLRLSLRLHFKGCLQRESERSTDYVIFVLPNLGGGRDQRREY